MTNTAQKPDSAEILAFALKVFNRVIRPNIVGLQKAIELVASSKNQKPAQVRVADMPALVLVQGQAPPKRDATGHFRR
jgi:hypothetical protein